MKAKVVALIASLMPLSSHVLQDKIQAHREMNLAPPPINFTHEEIRINDTLYDVDYSDNKLDIQEHNDHKFSSLIMMGILVVGSFSFYAALFYGLILWFWGIKGAIDVTMALLTLVLIFHVWWIIWGRRK